MKLARPGRDSSDWNITIRWDCPGCDLCPDLRAFLASPEQQVLEWPLAKRHRQHRPYTLVLRKTEQLFADDRAERERLAEALEAATALGALDPTRRKRRARKK